MNKVKHLSRPPTLLPLISPTRQKRKTVPTLSTAMKTITNNMSYYSTNHLIDKGLNISQEEKRFISRYMVHNRSVDHLQRQEGETQITIPDIQYNNPFTSLGIIKGNKKIYNEVTKTLEEQQINSYNNSISRINSQIQKRKGKNMPKIKVSLLFPQSPIDLTKENEEDSKNGTSVFIPQLKNKLYCYYCYPYKNFPEVRDHCTMTQYGNCYYLIGGIGSILSSSNSVWKLDMGTLLWNKLTNSQEQLTPQNRFGHTSICYQNILYVIGGRTKYNHSYVFSDFDFYDLEKNKFTYKQCYTRDRLQFRYGHISHLINNQIIVHGGINEDGKVLNDTFIISLSPFKTLSAKVSYEYPGPYLYGHCEALAVPKDIATNPRTNIYKLPDIQFGKRVNLKLKEKGLYVFGGKDEKGVIRNDLYLLTIGTRPLNWTIIQTNGEKPLPRYDASLTFYEKGNVLILFGGRTDKYSDKFALNDLYFLDLFSFDWIKINLYNNADKGFDVIPRCGHCSFLFDDKLFIFGGMNSKNFVGSALFVVNLNLDYNPQIDNYRPIEKHDIKEAQRQLTLRHHTSVHLKSIERKYIITNSIKEEDLL